MTICTDDYDDYYYYITVIVIIILLLLLLTISNKWINFVCKIQAILYYYHLNQY